MRRSVVYVTCVIATVVTVLLMPVLSRPANAEGLGLFPVRNFQPVQLLFLGIPGDRAAVLPKGKLDIRTELAETNTVFSEQTPTTNVTLKLETLRTGLFFRYGLTDQLEIGIEIPAIYQYRGFLNGLISQTERLTTGLTGTRQQLENTGFAYHVNKNGQTFFKGTQGSFGQGDITLSGKYQLFTESERMPALSARALLKVPTGDATRDLGSGHADVGLGLAAEKMLLSRWIAYANVNGIIPTGRVGGLSVRPYMTGLAAVEFLWTKNFSLVAQFDYYSTPFHDTGFKFLDRGVTEVAAGFNYRLQHNVLWQVYGVENLDFITGSAADFTLSTVMTYRF
jgi:hypothetical protein